MGKMRKTCQGQTNCKLWPGTVVHLCAMPWLKINRDSTAILALVRLCKTDGQDVSVTLVWYQDMGTVRAFDIATIDCVVG